MTQLKDEVAIIKGAARGICAGAPFVVDSDYTGQ